MDNNILKYRSIIRFVIEAATPMAVGNGTKSILSDALVAKDANGLPFIPGTSITGVLRHGIEAISKDLANKFFGTQNRGSELIISDAVMIGEDGKAVDGLCEKLDKDFYLRFSDLPIRQHVRIDQKGTACKGGKFDNEVVYKGTRFVFEIEKMAEEADSEAIRMITRELLNPAFRLGSGTRNGLGAIKVVDIKSRTFDLSDMADLNAYVSRSSSLSEPFDGDTLHADKIKAKGITYELHLKPCDFMLFASGLGDEDADITPLKEDIILWNEMGVPHFDDRTIVIPATSLKGALSHRTAYHYNRTSKVFADKIETGDFKNHVGDNNNAVRALFGGESEEITRGKVILTDIVKATSHNTHILHHVKIDRFTNAPIDGALFQEKVTDANGEEFCTTICIPEQVAEQNAIESFEQALDDLCNGLLPLGGGVNRGHGRFTGYYKKTEED